MKYFLAIEIKAQYPMAEVCLALRSAFENGASGEFQILTTRHSTFMVIFERNAVDDGEYVHVRLNTDTSVERAAMHQLADELDLSEGHPSMTLMSASLRDGDAQCFDFSMGAIESMAVFESDTV